MLNKRAQQKYFSKELRIPINSLERKVFPFLKKHRKKENTKNYIIYIHEE